MSEVMLSAASLVTPETATQSVSRSEIVNLMVLDYIGRAEVEAAALAAAAESTAVAAKAAVEAAWTAYEHEARARACDRAAAWRSATEALVTPAAVRDMGVVQLPTGCTVSSTGQISTPDGYDRDTVFLATVVSRWLWGSAPEVIDYEAPIVGVHYRQREPITLAQFPVEVWLRVDGQNDRTDFNRVKFVVDLRPSDHVRALLSEARAAVEAMNVAHRRHGEVRATIDEKNVNKLERRALAALTTAALGPLAASLPQIAVRS